MDVYREIPSFTITMMTRLRASSQKRAMARMSKGFFFLSIKFYRQIMYPNGDCKLCRFEPRLEKDLYEHFQNEKEIVSKNSSHNEKEIYHFERQLTGVFFLSSNFTTPHV